MGQTPLVNRRTTLAWLSSTAPFALTGTASAVEPEVPIRLQVSLLDRVIPFDRKFGLRVHGRLSVAVLVDKRSIDSVRIGEQLLAELSAVSTLGNYPFSTARVGFTAAKGAAEECKRLQAGVVCLTPGLREPPLKVARALEGQRCLTVATMADDVAFGCVLGFAVRSGKPRVLVNLAQARQQEVDFRADFLRMAEILE